MRMPVALAALVLAGCPSVSGREWDRVRDRDGDGQDAVRFGGLDCFDDDPSIAICDGDHDGHDAIGAGGDDCDDADASVVRRTFFEDRDQDGFGDPDRPVDSCEQGSLVANADDCDDTADTIHPGAEENCDDVDRNCDGDPYRGAESVFFWLDEDGDGFGGARSSVTRCVPADGEVDNDRDCDDFRADVYPGAPGEVSYDGVDTDCDGASDFDADRDGEDALAYGGLDCDDTRSQIGPGQAELCNGVDDDCDGLVDDADDDAQQLGQVVVYRDEDGDGFGGVLGQFCADAIPSGWVDLGGDCDDTTRATNPLADERCNGVDDDCSGVADDNAVDGPLWFVDQDRDGWGAAIVVGRFCGQPPDPEHASTRDGDCDDADEETYPGAPEVCYDGRRQDCDPGRIDDCDLDGDPDATDCDDRDPSVSAGAVEVCDGVDNDCDGATDDADPSVVASTARAWFQDVDGDGFGGAPLFTSCAPPPDGVDNDLDCDDTDDERHPFVGERCNGLDDDCDGVVDESPVDPPALWLDLDGDGFGDPASPLTGTCTNPDPARWVPVAGDCAPLDAAVSPAATEVCDHGVDNDCDGLVDDADTAVDGAVWYLDADGDGFGVAFDRVVACSLQAGRSLLAGDCRDDDALVFPGAPELCNGGVDDDCDGRADEADPGSGAVTFYRDLDGDGFGDPADPAPVAACAPPAGHAPNAADCDDGRADVHPGGSEVCDPGDTDEDCDGLADDLDPGASGLLTFYLDADGDGFGGTPRLACDLGDLFLTLMDCNDANANAFPGNPSADQCDGLDHDCDGTVDPLVTRYADQDGDGWGSGPPVQQSCQPQAGWAVLDGDCDDGAISVHPGFPYELCGDLVDNNCDGLQEPDDPLLLGCDASTGTDGRHLYWADGDGDGYGDPGATPVLSASSVPGAAPNALDCDDTDPATSPTLVTTAAELQAAFQQVRAAGTCAAIEVAPGLYTVTLATPASATNTLLVGPVDGVGGRPTFTRSRLTVSRAQTTLVWFGIDAVPDVVPQADWPVTVTNGTFVVADALLADGGLRQTGGTVTTRALTVAEPPPATTGGASALWISLPSDTLDHTAEDLTILDAGGVRSVRADTGTFRRVRVARSAPFVVSNLSYLGFVTRDVVVEDAAFTDCLGTCVELEGSMSRRPLLRFARVERAGADGVLTGNLGQVPRIEHTTIVSSAGDGVAGSMGYLFRSIVWDSRGYDFAGTSFTIERTLWDTDPGTGWTPISNPSPATYAPAFQSQHWTLPGARWDLHLASRANGVYAFQGGDLGVYPLSDPWYDDTDGDGLPDGWELDWLSDLSEDGAGDRDGDGVDNAAELLQGTMPLLPDTDGDGADDGGDSAPLDAGTR